MINKDNITNLEILSNQELIAIINKMVERGVSLSFFGKKNAQYIEKKVKPRQVEVIQDLSCSKTANRNKLIEGENLQAMVTLYKYRNSVDLILTDPPYNTGKDFRYNDKWDEDPNDPYLGELVKLEDGSRHTKWMKFMLPRLQMMKAMLKKSGVLAICIDDRELYHLGMLLDEIFGEDNRIGIINWQKSYSPRNDNTHISTATEYVLVYAKNLEYANTSLLSRTDKMNSIYTNPDKDPNGDWTSGDPCARTPNSKDRYAIQSPFTGDLHYPGTGSWRFKKTDIKAELESWGIKYVEKSLNDGRAKALVIKNGIIPEIPVNQNLDDQTTIEFHGEANSIMKKGFAVAEKIRINGVYPKIFFLKEGKGRPRYKRYLSQVKKGRVPLTYWADEDYEEEFILGCQSWPYEESGHSQTGIRELDYVVGKGHGFTTVKPLKLFEKIIQLWCPNDGIVLDPFAGSGTTGHAVMELNALTGSERAFILIEKGEESDDYTRSLTQVRLARAISGERVDKDGKIRVLESPMSEGFDYWFLKREVDASTILKMRREEIIDVILTSHWEEDTKKSAYNLERFQDNDFKYLVGKNLRNEGFFIIWDGEKSVGQLDINVLKTIANEAKLGSVKPPYHVYARYQLYQSPNVMFYQIPDKILAHLGLNENSDRYNNEEEE
ncbi:site-specific DNA-methyltransferase [Papillibacter cinnamivorans]|uniref:Adenine-specific DNA-methyltransferase n=1 Tax=Papillibacter cinnamivorans DSM 12816 TaxID=1122930 RepID=A0A1W2AJN2_9FIRM|nr:site-specific DNA-methyltransferase [Papillibacter cinnamivorans]SMC60887.1 adenine-specific DNA-methyltransferase [Papillibacter cinnamivorans DSM 12816]